MAKRKVLYMKVSNDEYELPEAIADSIAELARIIGVKRNVISSAMSHAKKKGFKSSYVKVIIESEVEE